MTSFWNQPRYSFFNIFIKDENQKPSDFVFFAQQFHTCKLTCTSLTPRQTMKKLSEKSAVYYLHLHYNFIFVELIKSKYYSCSVCPKKCNYNFTCRRHHPLYQFVIKIKFTNKSAPIKHSIPYCAISQSSMENFCSRRV